MIVRETRQCLGESAQIHQLAAPGQVDVEIDASGKRATSVRVAGHATIVFQAEIEV